MKTTITIKGTHCPSCKALIEDIAKETKGITSCTANYKTGKVVIEHGDNVDWAYFKKEIESLGKYKVIV